MVIIADPYRWQSPGNGRLFDSSLEDWENNLMSQRAIGVLEFIEDNPLIEKNEFEMRIAPYLDEKFGHDPNESNKGHFFRSAEFVGLVRNLDGLLSLSIDGKNFLNSMLDGNYEAALEFYVLQLLKTTYPNNATEQNRLSLFPFRILFKLLSRDNNYGGKIPKKMFYTDIPYITKFSDIDSVKAKLHNEKYLNFLKNNSLKVLEDKCPHFYPKWATWVMSSLNVMNIVEMSGKRGKECFTLASPINDFIEGIVDKMYYEDMFFESSNDLGEVKNNIRCKPRNPQVIQSVLEESDYKCFFNEKHITFPSNTRKNYVEGHHVIPVSLNDSFEEELDCEDNVIALCPNCHKAIHLSTNEYKEDLLKYIIDNDDKLSRFDITLEDLKEFYFTQKVHKPVEIIEFRSTQIKKD